MRSLSFIVLAGLVASSGPASSGELLYTLEAQTTLPSTDTDWDYIKLDQASGRLFIARRGDGLTVFDVDRQRLVKTITNSKGANGPLLLPSINRGHVVTTDGDIVTFELRSLKVLSRRKIATDGGLNTVTFDPVTQQIHAIVSSRPKESTWYTLDASTGALISQRAFPFRKMDEPAPDGKGHLFAPARFDNLLLKLDSRTLAENDRWKIDCNQVVTVEYQDTSDRLFVGCRGDAPKLIVLDAATGRQVSSVPIGKGIDGMVIDKHRGRIVTSNGGDSTLTVIKQDGANAYRLLGTVQTRPQARTMQMDEHTGRIFLVTAAMTTTVPAVEGAAPVQTYHPNSFTVMTYAPR